MSAPRTERAALEDEPVLPAVARGDGPALQTCIERYDSLVWSMARRFTSSWHDAEDAVQEIYFDLWKSAGRFDLHTGPERTFVSIIARRRLIDRLRRRRVRPDMLPLTDELLETVPCSRSVHDTAELGIARAALRVLPARQRRVLMLAVVAGLSHSEIARHAGMPLGTVKTLIRRGLARLRRTLRIRRTLRRESASPRAANRLSQAHNVRASLPRSHIDVPLSPLRIGRGLDPVRRGASPGAG